MPCSHLTVLSFTSQPTHSIKKGRIAMHASRLFLYVPLFAFLFIAPGYGQISSWTDENGVRHFSNVETLEEKKSVEIIEEYETNASDQEVDQNRDRFQILRMYEEDREEKEKQEALEKEMRETEEREKNDQAAAEKAARERKEACAERERKLEDLRHTKWEDFDAPDLYPIVCPDRRWKGARGKAYDNMKECTERRDRARKSAYEQAIGRQEEEVEKFCSQ
jgi:hypothetical protein